MTATQTPAQRRALRMRAVFAEGRTAGLAADDVRSLARQIIGCGLSEATLGQLDQVLGHLKRGKRREGAGGNSGNEWAFVFGATPERQRLLKKIYRQAQRLGALMAPPVPAAPVHYIEGIVAQMRGLRPHAPNARVSLALSDETQLATIVQILTVYLDRHGG